MIFWWHWLRLSCWIMVYIYAGRDSDLEDSVMAFEYDLTGFLQVQTFSSPARHLFAANESMDTGIWNYE